MKKLLSILTAIFMLILLLPITTVYVTEVDNAAQSEEEPTSNEIREFDFSQPIKVGYYSNLTHLVNDLDSLNNKGYGYEVLQKITEISDLEFEYVEIQGDLIDALNSGVVDIAGLNIKTDERQENLLFSLYPLTKAYSGLVSKNFNISYSDFSQIDGKTVATYPDNYAQNNFDKICDDYGISVEYVYGDMHNYTELEADLYLAYSGNREFTDYNNILNVGINNLYLATSYENSELMDTINDIYYQLIITEGNYFMELEEKYLSENIEINHRGLTIDEIETLRKRPLEVGYITGYSPISYTNDLGEPDGALVNVLNNFSERYGFLINYHPYNLNDPPEENDNFDILLTLYGKDGNDLENYVTTEAFYNIPMYAVVDLDSMGTTDKTEIMASSPKIGLLPYQVIDFTHFIAAYPDTELIYYTVWHELLDDLITDEIDMLFCTETATTYVELYFDNENIFTIHTDTVAPMKLFINNDIAEEYVPIFNIIIDRYSDTEYAAILETNANKDLPSDETSFLEFLAMNWYYFVLLAFIIIGCFIALYYRGQISKREALLKSYNTDPVTGLMSINKFRATLDDVISKAKPNEYELISFDIDMFKTINTHFSSDRGTTIIKAISNALKIAFEGTNAIISRRMADQFLIFRRINDGDSIRHIYKNSILPAIEDNINTKYKVSLSFGSAIANNVTVTTLIGQADNARLAGKPTHSTTFITFDDKMRKHYENKVNITFRMEQALKDREFTVEYQPKIDFTTLQLGGAEALVRWTPRLGEKMYPDDFIPIFEANGFISYLDLYVLDKVCKHIKTNCNKIEIPRIAVNLSAHTVLAENIVSRVSDILSIHDISPQRIELELTESAVEANTDKFLATVKQFKKLGFAISIDDFGAGVSSLNRLSAVEADVLKLDKAFFDLKDQGSNSTIVVADVINMAKHLKMKVVAEGVETAAQALWLQSIGCDYAQGYYFAKPMSENDFINLIREKKQYKISLTSSFSL